LEKVVNENIYISSFNNPLESGIRAVGILTCAYPKQFDLQKLVIFDHLIVHTGDIGGPESLHPKLPMRSTEILVRRNLIERGLLLMMSRNLIERIVTGEGIFYSAGELSETFLDSLTSPYLLALKARTQWVVSNFGDLNDDGLKQTTRMFFDQWIEEFHIVQKSLGA
jgi:hypothetical protein